MALTTNITHYWKFDGNSNDSVGSNNGTDTSITYNNTNGIINNGAGFANNASANIQVGALSFGTTGTITAWIKGTPGDGAFIHDSSGSRFYFWCPSAGTGINANFGGADTGTVTISYGTWTFVALTWDGVNGQFYKNGATLGASMAFAPTGITTTNSFIGSRFTGNAVSFDSLDEIGIWSRALTSTEVTQLYNAGAGLQYPFSSPIIRSLSSTGAGS